MLYSSGLACVRPSSHFPQLPHPHKPPARNPSTTSAHHCSPRFRTPGAPAPGGTASDFSRGKRLKRLLKLIGGRQATSALRTLNTHMYVVLAAMVLLHVACFAALLAVIGAQKAAVTNISAAGASVRVIFSVWLSPCVACASVVVISHFAAGRV